MAVTLCLLRGSNFLQTLNYQGILLYIGGNIENHFYQVILISDCQTDLFARVSKFLTKIITRD